MFFSAKQETTCRKGYVDIRQELYALFLAYFLHRPIHELFIRGMSVTPLNSL